MQINSTNHPAQADKSANRPKTREAREASAAKESTRQDAAAKQSGRDAFIPSSPVEKSVTYKPPAARQVKPSEQAEAPREADSADSSAVLKPKPQVNELLAKIKAANPEELLGAQQKAASDNIAALLEAEE